MTIAERLQLHKLGYTKEEINQLAADNYNPAGLVEPPAEPQPQPEPEPITAPDPVEAPAQPQQPQQPDQMGEMLQAIRQLTATLQKSNIRNSQQPETPNIAQQADEVLATFLNT